MKLLRLIAGVVIGFVALLQVDGASARPPTGEVAKRMLQRRAVEAVVWSMPAVNYQLMYQAAVRAKASFNQVVFWSRLASWRNQTLTPNPDVIYLMPFFNTEGVGPIVLEIPAAEGGVINGSVMNYWQAAIEDVGPVGVDQGKGGKYLILPPGYTQPVPAGYIPLRSDTFRTFALLRSIPTGSGDGPLAQAVAYAKRIAVYPLSRAASPPKTAFVDVADTVYDAAIPYDLRFYRALDEIVQAEPWLERDRAMIDPLKTIGIERGKPFKPDAATQALLEGAIKEAKAWLDVSYEALLEPFYPKGNWGLPADPELKKSVESSFTVPDSYPIDARGTSYTFAFFSPRHMGVGQFYLLAIGDGEGQPLEGNARYRMTVPAHVPVRQYWSATAYNRATHTLIRDLKRPGRSSQSPGLVQNADVRGSSMRGARALG